MILFVAFALLAFSFHGFSTTKTLLAHGLRAQGQITKIKEERKPHTSTVNGRQETTRSPSYRAIVTFRDKAGRTFKFNDNFSSEFLPYYRGETVTVLYMKESPAKSAIIDRGFLNWVGPGILGIFGGLLLLLGGGIIFGHAKIEQADALEP